MDHHKNSLADKTTISICGNFWRQLPIEYQKVLDPLDVLEYVAANTTKISLGTLDVLCAC